MVTLPYSIGDDVLEVAAWGAYFLNGVSEAEMPAKLSGYPVMYEQKNEKEHVFDIILDGKEHIRLATFKDWVNIKIESASYSNFKGSLGMMGKYMSGEKVGRDGKTVIEDDLAFGQEWQVQDTEPKLFQILRDPQHPHQQCIVSSPTTEDSRRRLGETVARAAAEEACAQNNHYDNVDHCVFDGK